MNNMYWEYAGTRYTQKYLAIQAAGKDQSSIRFNIFGKPFHSFNWSVEPSQSFKELCKQRALQLRDQYKYIRLWFSGGADSTTMLNVFLENNIHLDEIMCYRMSPINDFSCRSNSEINNYVIPYLRSLDVPKTKIKIMDVGDEYYGNLLKGDKYFYTKNKNDLREYYVPKIRGKTFCNLFGDSDPNIKLIDGKWYETIWDTTCYLEYRYNNMELFFTSENLLELHAKQCHILKNYCKEHFSHNEADFKKILRKILRDNPIVKDASEFSKLNIHTSRASDFSVHKKDHVMLRNSDLEQQKLFSGLMNTTVSGTPIHMLYGGFMSGKYYLGDS